MEQDRPKRREMLSLARTQLKLVAVVCVPLIVACVAVSVLQTYFFLSSVRGKWVAVIVIVVMASACFTVAVIVGHRIVGPMRRLEARLKSIAAGKIVLGFHMREGDDLTFVGKAVAEMEDSLSKRIGQCRETSEQIAQALKRLEAQTGQEAQALVAELSRASAALRDQLGAFELEEEENGGELRTEN